MEDEEFDPSTDDQGDRDQEGQGDQELTFADWVERAIYTAGAIGKPGDEARDALQYVSSPRELTEPGMREHLETIGAFQPEVRDFLVSAADLAAAEDTAAEVAAHKSERERLDGELIDEIKTERAQKEEQAERDRRKRELEDQLDAPASDGGESEPETKLDAGPFKTIFEGPDPNEIFVPDAPPGERKRVLDARFQVIEEQQPFLESIDRFEDSIITEQGIRQGVSVANRLLAWDSLSPEEQGVAQALGHTPPIDVGIGTPEYEERLEASRASRKQRAEWLAERRKGGSK